MAYCNYSWYRVSPIQVQFCSLQIKWEQSLPIDSGRWHFWHLLCHGRGSYGKKQVRSWWMDTGYEDWWKKCIRTSNIAHFINGNWTEWSAIWSEIIPVTGVASFSTSSRPSWLSLPHILKIARMTSPHWPRQHFELKAPSTRIRRFLYPQFFLCGYKNICVHT